MLSLYENAVVIIITIIILKKDKKDIKINGRCILTENSFLFAFL